MKLDRNSKYFVISLHALGVILVAALFWQCLQHFSFFSNYLGGILKLAMPFFYGFVIAYLVNPIMMFYDRNLFAKLKLGRHALKRGLSLLCAIITAGILVTVFFYIVLPQVVTSLYSLFTILPDFVVKWSNIASENLQHYLSMMPLSQDYIEQLTGQLFGGATAMLESAKGILPHLYNYTMAVGNVLKNLVIGVIISIYMLASKERFAGGLKKAMYAIVSKERGDKILELCEFINSTFSGFIYAKVLDSLIVGVLCYILMKIFGLNYAMLISFIVGVTNVIPYFGPFIGAIPSILVLLVDGGMLPAGIFTIMILVLQQFDGNILGPKLMGQSIGLSSFWVIFAVLVMGGVFGVMGMFIGVPLFAVIYRLMKEYLEGRLKKKGLPVATTDYVELKK